MLDAVDLPDVAALKAMLIASQLREVRKDERIERLEKLVTAFGRKSVNADPEQFDFALEDLETATAAVMPRTRSTALRVSRSQNLAPPIVALFPHTFFVSKRSSTRRA